MKALIVIPARYGSTRFPGKPFALISGVTLIQRVYERSVTSRAASAVYVATDDQRIASHVASFGGRCVMTGEAESGTDRIAQALTAIERETSIVYDQVINVQGDEPLIDISSVDAMIEALQSEPIDIVTLSAPLASEAELFAPDIVKVVTDLSGNALYFSRAPIPHGSLALARRHVGLYGYQTAMLKRFASLPPSPLEQSERLEQLRALQNGYRIRVLHTSAPHLGVDRPEDIAKVESELAKLRSSQREQ